MKDLTGKRVGRLVVVGDSKREGYVVCKCDCGNTIEIKKYSLTKTNPTQSCRCYQREISRERVTAARATLSESIKRYGTNVMMLVNGKLYSNNHSGHTGVFYDAPHSRYISTIRCQNKRYYLGSYKTLGEAVKAREEAEDKLFSPIIDRWHADTAATRS